MADLYILNAALKMYKESLDPWIEAAHRPSRESNYYAASPGPP